MKLYSPISYGLKVYNVIRAMKEDFSGLDSKILLFDMKDKGE